VPESVQIEIPPPETAPSESAAGAAEPSKNPRRGRFGGRRVLLPAVLFLLTCASTFFAGVTGWMPGFYVGDPAEWQAGLNGDASFLIPARRAVLVHWRDGLIYMGCILAILMTHEMGHFVMTVVYRIRATLPLFIPFPISPIGTMGAVIAMDGSKANRRQIFDIGLAGPLAGLAVAVPIIWIGAARLNLNGADSGSMAVELPWIMRLLVDHLHPGAYRSAVGVPLETMNPYFMAGWVGLLITALNMMPVSQLDGGHVTYALFGWSARVLARLFMLAAFSYFAISLIYFNKFPFWAFMALLVFLIGTDHPPTRDDEMQLGWFRWTLGLASLAIPVVCFTPNPFRM
jgi:hypothetical protein